MSANGVVNEWGPPRSDGSTTDAVNVLDPLVSTTGTVFQSVPNVCNDGASAGWSLFFLKRWNRGFWTSPAIVDFSFILTDCNI